VYNGVRNYRRGRTCRRSYVAVRLCDCQYTTQRFYVYVYIPGKCFSPFLINCIYNFPYSFSFCVKKNVFFLRHIRHIRHARRKKVPQVSQVSNENKTFFINTEIHYLIVLCK
jgi:hypothetical protein